ncbi:MAG: TVP38/TMEM64 family protein [Clostridia bacterium]|nr:TVP38/TMEM64 family protein [Clostridia bacterium]
MGKKKEKVKQMFRDKELEEVKHYSKRTAATILSVVSVLTCILSVLGFLFLKAKFQETNVLRDWIFAHPYLGSVLMILISALQVVVALIPGEVVEIAAGYAFGTWWGALLCLFGIVLGSICSILLARRFGRRLVESLYPKEKLDALPILHEPKKRNPLVAILFLIPGTPKDLLTYVIGLTEMSIPLYILLTTACRFPSVLISTMSGAALGDDRLLKAVYLLIATGVVSILGYGVYSLISKKNGKSKSNKSKER